MLTFLEAALYALLGLSPKSAQAKPQHKTYDAQSAGQPNGGHPAYTRKKLPGRMKSGQTIKHEAAKAHGKASAKSYKRPNESVSLNYGKAKKAQQKIEYKAQNKQR